MLLLMSENTGEFRPNTECCGASAQDAPEFEPTGTVETKTALGPRTSKHHRHHLLLAHR